MSRAEGIDKAREAVGVLIEEAAPYLEFLADEIPSDAPHTALETRLQELGTLAVTLTPLAQDGIITRVVKRFPTMSKRAIRRVFGEALAKAELQRRSSGQAPTPDGQRGSGQAQDPTKIGKLAGGITDQMTHFENGEGDRVTSFGLRVTATIVPREGGQDLLRVDVEVPGPNGIGTRVVAKDWIIPAKCWSNKRTFQAAFPSNEMQSTMSDNELQALHEYLTRGGLAHLPRIHSTPVLGLDITTIKGQKRIVLKAGTLDENGWMENPDLVYLANGGSNLDSRLPTEKHDIDDEEVKAIARTFAENVLSVHSPEVIATWNAWWVAALFKPMFRASGFDGFPIAAVPGSPGAGKTSLIRMFWSAYGGVANSAPASATSSLFALTRDFSGSSSIPTPTDEVKTVEMRNDGMTLQRMYKRLWGGESESRGHADQSMTNYILCAPGLLAGEQLWEDPAMLERVLPMRLDRNWIPNHPESTEAYERIARLPLWKMGALVQRWTLRAPFDDLMAHARRVLTDTLMAIGRRGIPDRVKTNLTAMMLGVVAFEAFAKDLGVTVARPNVVKMTMAILGEILQEDEQGMPGKFVRDAGDSFLAEVSNAALSNVLESGREFRYDHTARRLYVSIALSLRALEAWFRSMGRAIPWPGDRALTIIFKEKHARPDSYVVSVGERCYLKEGGARVRCVVIDLSKVPESLGVEEFKEDVANSGVGLGQQGITMWNRYSRGGEEN